MSFDPASVPAHVSPRLRQRAGAGARLPAGAAAAAALSRSRALYPSRRLSPEQRELREVVRAQQEVGRLLEPLVRRGAQVLHSRRAPGSAFDLDHVVITAGVVLVLIDVVSSKQAPIALDEFGSLARAGIPLARRQDLLRAAAVDVATECGRHLPEAWRVLVVPAVIVAGHSDLATPVVSRGATVVPAEALARWASETFPPTIDALGVAQIADAVDAVCPTAA